jgi:hypothetical protein
MADKTDWGKHGVIAAYGIGIPLILLGILTFVRPPDPAHPMSFDFLSKSIVMPPWLAMMLGFALIGSTMLADRWWFKKIYYPSLDPIHLARISDLERNLAKANAALTRASMLNPDVVASGGLAHERPTIKGSTSARDILTVERKPFAFDPACKSLTLKWTEGMSALIEPYQNDAASGLVLYVVNHSSYPFESFGIEVSDVNSWNEGHQEFLPDAQPIRGQIIGGRDLPAVTRTEKGQWLVRVSSAGQLTLGPSGPVLVWPNQDPNPTQIWRLAICGLFQLARAQGNPTPSAVKPLLHRYLLVRWDPDNGAVQMAIHQED